MSQLTHEQKQEKLNKAFRTLCNLYFASEKDNFSKCSVFHIKPFDTHWDRRTVREIKHGMRLFLGSWVLPLMEDALGTNRMTIEKLEKKRHRESLARKKEFLKRKNRL